MTGYWSVPLEECSQLLITFWMTLEDIASNNCHSASIRARIFQQCMDKVLQNLKGCISIPDTACVFGATEEEHDARLVKLMEAAKLHSLVFNSDI